MASRRKRLAPQIKGADLYANGEFIAALVGGTVRATRLHDVRVNGVRTIEYDDPDPDRPGAPPDNR